MSLGRKTDESLFRSEYGEAILGSAQNEALNVIEIPSFLTMLKDEYQTDRLSAK